MGAVKLMVFSRSGRIECNGETYEVPACSLVFTNGNATAIPAREGIDTYVFHSGDFQDIYRELHELASRYRRGTQFWREPVKRITVPEETINVIRHLGAAEPRAMLRFAYVYCMGTEPEYFSRLLHHLIDSSRDFFEFIEENSMSAWPVTQYAKALGIPVRKLNVMFYEKFGVSAKNWLLERRLQRARELLLLTSMKVTDIAQECGFNSHAHFSVSFRRRYEASPRLLRQHHQSINDAANEE
ncbi:helix-turn-helix domain-containing protein [Cupriavidus gilardii]|uniref:helix-turn-helix transcriptional regulator n=1 Tax=Cupriavidus gilardii TaxID=82541 RepID=UPI001572CC08|nr:helix-turn-helix transcriptional regulator [Cupriavidus gilardii]MBO4123482.1 helix-turn-helix domain-containing protein [Cupriavidus gilardii]MCG5258922.1 helix-turn-helix transcriptional regulator [Cupriavidus gilardii]MDF9429085.1 helix-turn-helix domain-containing protein [Cupriavidus gilardii]NSX05775.1 helix-turn-helix domain-containing protein [Cupriavidus gilardii]